MSEGISALIHGDAGAGKSWLAQTTPGPRLVLDAEGGSRNPRRISPETGKSVRIPMVVWEPAKEPIPEVDGTWETAQVFIRSYSDFELAFNILNQGKHPFKSLVVDSLTEIQKKCRDHVAAGQTMTERQWGELLIRMELKVRELRDLIFHPTNPLDAVVILALSDTRGRKAKPSVQGALGVTLPGYVDVVGYLGAFPNEAGDGVERRLLIQPLPDFEAKDRTHVLSEHYGMSIPNPNFVEMLQIISEDENA